VLQALAEQTRSVRIPLNQNSNLVKLSRTETALTQQRGRSPTDREIADRMGEPVQTIRALRRVASAVGQGAVAVSLVHQYLKTV
jgi:RNA polymerase primary sigma factor